MKRVFREYRVELVATLMALLGIFLLVERMQIRVTILSFMRAAWRTVSGAVWAVVSAVVNRILHTTVSDLTGLVLIILAILIVLRRLRLRLLSRLQNRRACPVCGGELRRTHRRRWDRLLSLLVVRVARYRCKNEECHWEGLVLRTHQ